MAVSFLFLIVLHYYPARPLLLVHTLPSNFQEPIPYDMRFFISKLLPHFMMITREKETNRETDRQTEWLQWKERADRTPGRRIETLTETDREEEREGMKASRYYTPPPYPKAIPSSDRLISLTKEHRIEQSNTTIFHERSLYQWDVGLNFLSGPGKVVYTPENCPGRRRHIHILFFWGEVW